MKDEFKQWGGYAYHYSLSELNELDFMTPEEFYNNHNKLCFKLYLYVKKVILERQHSNQAQYDWHLKQCKIIKDNLDQIPILKDSSKFNL